MCPAVEDTDLVYKERSDSQSLTHSRPAECGSRQAIQARPDHPQWSLLPEVFQAICSRWHRPQINLFANRLDKLPQFVSLVPDCLAWVVDALSLPWEYLDAYAFPAVAILGKMVQNLQDHSSHRIIFIAQGWPNMPWFKDLVAMSSQVPLSMPNLPNLLIHPFSQTPHRNLPNLNLHAWLLKPQRSRNRASLRQWQKE